MHFTEDHNGEERRTNDIAWPHVERYLNRLDAASHSYCHLTDTRTGSYIQCAGSARRCTVEMRTMSAPDTDFRHYVLGKGPMKSPMKTIWDEIINTGYSIRVHDSEVLTSADAVALFHAFMDGRELQSYLKRNVTKHFR